MPASEPPPQGKAPEPLVGRQQVAAHRARRASAGPQPSPRRERAAPSEPERRRGALHARSPQRWLLPLSLMFAAAFVVTLFFDSWAVQAIAAAAPPGTWRHRIMKLSRYPFSTWGYVLVGFVLMLDRRTFLPRFDPPRLRRLIGYLVAVSVCFGTVHAIKPLVGRARPDQHLGPYHLRPFGDLRVGFDSFPSAHTAAAVLLTVYVMRYWPRLGWVLIPLATLASLSRVVQERHHVSDVFAGAGLAVVVLLLCVRWLGAEFYARPQPAVSDRAAPVRKRALPGPAGPEPPANAGARF